MNEIIQRNYSECMSQIIEVMDIAWPSQESIYATGKDYFCDFYRCRRWNYSSQSWICKDANTGWSWENRKKTHVPLGNFDPNRYKYDDDMHKYRKNVAKELNVIFTKVLPEEIIINIWLKTCIID